MNEAAPIRCPQHVPPGDTFCCSDIHLTHVRFVDTLWQLNGVAADGALTDPCNLDASRQRVHYLIVLHLQYYISGCRLSFDQGSAPYMYT